MFHGWLVVGGAFVSHLLSYGILTVAFGVFFPSPRRCRPWWARWWTGAARAWSWRSAC